MDQFVESHLLLVVGMAVILAALCFLAGMIWTLTWSEEKLNARKIRIHARKVETHQDDDGVNEDLIAVIAAAATAIMRRQVTIKHITFLSPAPGQIWAVTGRLNIMASHAIARRKTTS